MHCFGDNRRHHRQCVATRPSTGQCNHGGLTQLWHTQLRRTPPDAEALEANYLPLANFHPPLFTAYPSRLSSLRFHGLSLCAPSKRPDARWMVLTGKPHAWILLHTFPRPSTGTNHRGFHRRLYSRSPRRYPSFTISSCTPCRLQTRCIAPSSNADCAVKPCATRRQPRRRCACRSPSSMGGHAVKRP